jgi:hypothetical protein
MILFVPFDIFLTLKNERAGVEKFTDVIFFKKHIKDEAYSKLSEVYAYLYWIIFILAWTVLPIV